MPNPDWTKEVPMAITVTDAEGIILEMNEKSAATFEKDGGCALIGTSALACHPEPSRTKVAGMLRGSTSNIYTIEKKGAKKMIVQMPWFAQGKPAGLVELSIELPENIPHFIRG